MTIASFTFIGFALLVALCYNARESASWRQLVLLAANVIFLASFSRNLLSFVPLAVFLVLGYLAVGLMRQPHSRRLFEAVIVGIILVFIWLKKYTFLPGPTFLTFAYTTLGLSYIFFRIMHMVIDAHEGSLKEKPTLITFLNYTLNFATLISGPIQLFPDFVRQHLSPTYPKLSAREMGTGLERVVTGFFKVNVLSLILSMLQHHALDTLSSSQPLLSRSLTGAAIAAIYPFYLFFNFSGYTDIVIGIAIFLRIALPENFDRPFSTTNFLDFWNHWHMTLSGWLKKYLYTPLVKSLMRRFPSNEAELPIGITAFFVTFFFIGVWHGRTSEFIFYGVLLGAGVSLNKLYQVLMARHLGKKRFRALSSNPLYNTFCRGLNFTFFAFYLLWFWSTWQDLDTMRHALGAGGQALGWLLIFAVSTVLLAAWEWLRTVALTPKWEGAPLLLSRYARTVRGTALAFVSLAVVALMDQPAPDVVYKAF